MELDWAWLSPDLRSWLINWPLLFFFVPIGQEIRKEITTQRKHILVPFSAAMVGMVVPALIYLAGALLFHAPKRGWGIPMATDLPLLLIVLFFIPKHISKQIRSFVLLFAVCDDLGSLVALSLLTLTTGIQPSILGAIIGIIIGSKFMKFFEVVGYYIALPLFFVATFSLNLSFGVNTATSPLFILIIVARLIGKPIGIYFGAKLGYRAIKIQGGHETRIPNELLFFCGVLGTLGLSVAMVFANAALGSGSQPIALIGILATLPIATLMIFIFSRRLRNLK